MFNSMAVKLTMLKTQLAMSEAPSLPELLNIIPSRTLPPALFPGEGVLGLLFAGHVPLATAPTPLYLYYSKNIHTYIHTYIHFIEHRQKGLFSINIEIK